MVFRLQYNHEQVGRCKSLVHNESTDYERSTNLTIGTGIYLANSDVSYILKAVGYDLDCLEF